MRPCCFENRLNRCEVRKVGDDDDYGSESSRKFDGKLSKAIVEIFRRYFQSILQRRFANDGDFVVILLHFIFVRFLFYLSFSLEFICCAVSVTGHLTVGKITELLLLLLLLLLLF